MKNSYFSGLQTMYAHVAASFLKFALSCFLLLLSNFIKAQWVKKADAFKKRSEVSSVVYNDKLYAFLGFSDSLLNTEPSAEAYDPISNKWTLLNSIPPEKSATHQGVVLVDDKVWHIGGRVGINPAPLTSEVWIYNITTNTWLPGPQLRDPATSKPLLWGGGGAALLGRTIHVFGGFVNTACYDQDGYHLTLDVDEWLANPAQAGLWKNELAPLPLKRNHFGTIVLEGKIYALGGQLGHDCNGGLDKQYSHVYNPAANTWKALPLLSSPRSHVEGSTFSLDGKIYVVAGQGKDGLSTNKVSIFDPAGNNGAGSWKDDNSLTLPKSYEGLSAKVINNKFIISHGGEGSSRNTRNITYTRTLLRIPLNKLGFLSNCVDLSNSLATVIKARTWLFTINGTKNYTTSSNAGWLKVTKNSTGFVNPNATEIEITATTTDLAPGDYTGTITAVETGSGADLQEAVLCIKLSVYPSEETPSSFVTNIVATSGQAYILSQLSEGIQMYTDRNSQVTAIPIGLYNAPFIKTPNNDKIDNSAALLSFNVSKKATVFIAVDPRAKTLPAWLNGFQKLESKIAITDSKVSFMNLYSKNYEAGKVTLGGNLQSPANGAMNNYFVIVQPVQYNLQVVVNGNGSVDKNPAQGIYQSGASVTLTALPSEGHQFSGWNGSVNSTVNPITILMDTNKVITASFVVKTDLVTNITSGTTRSYILGELRSGDAVYTDRAYRAITVPAFLNNAPLIKTPIDDKDNRSPAALSFYVKDSSAVYIAYDPRAISLPLWLGAWQKIEGLFVTREDLKISSMQLYRKTFPAGKVILGGNSQSPAGGALSNYFVMVMPQQLQHTTYYKRNIINSYNPVSEKPDRHLMQPNKKPTLHFMVYPNPSSGGNIYLEANNFSKYEIVTITLLDASGNLVESSKAAASEQGTLHTILKPKRAGKGLYVLKAASASHSVQQKLVIK